MNLKSIYHVNVNCTNFNRSFEFYKMLGFRPIVGPAPSPKWISDKVLMLGPDTDAYGVIMEIGDDKYCSHLDLIEWKKPKTAGRPYERVTNLGITRLCFYSKNIWQDYATLKARGVKFYSEPNARGNAAGQPAIVCFEDPDGVILELVQVLRSPVPETKPGPDPDGKLNIVSIYHLGVNCSDIERSRKFYESLGFRLIADLGERAADASDERVLHATGVDGVRALLLGVGDDPRCSNIELMQWRGDKNPGRPYEGLDHCGIARTCFYSKNIWRDYEELKGRGLHVYAEPEVMRYGSSGSAVVCFEDPDGAVLELVQYQKSPEKPPKPW